MSVVVNTNVDSLKIQNRLTNATNKMAKSMERMSTGLKLNNAKDDAAGSAISARLQVQLDGNEVAQANVQNANALLAVAEGSLDTILDNLTRIRDLTLQAKNGTYSESERKAMDDEVKERMAEIDRISNSSSYSTLKLFGDGTSGLSKTGATFQVGYGSDENNIIVADNDMFGAVTFSTLTKMTGTVNKLTKDNLDLSQAGESGKVSFTTALQGLDAAIDVITSRKSKIGTIENRLDTALDTLTTQFENLTSANSVIKDADIASEASKYTQYQILQEMSVSLLATANQQPSIALSLV